MEKNFTIDRFEGIYAVMIGDEGSTLDVLREALPESVKEGDVIRFDSSGFTIDEYKTEKRSEEIQSRFDRLKKRRTNEA